MIFTLYTCIQPHQAKPSLRPSRLANSSRKRKPLKKIPQAPFTSLSTAHLQCWHRKTFLPPKFWSIHPHALQVFDVYASETITIFFPNSSALLSNRSRKQPWLHVSIFLTVRLFSLLFLFPAIEWELNRGIMMTSNVFSNHNAAFLWHSSIRSLIHWCMRACARRNLPHRLAGASLSVREMRSSSARRSRIIRWISFSPMAPYPWVGEYLMNNEWSRLKSCNLSMTK